MGQLAGADVEALLRTAEAMLDVADHLELVDLRTAEGLATLGWNGADANRVRATWDEQHAMALHVTADLLRTGAERLVTEAEDQEATSGAGTAGGSGPTSGPAAGAAGAAATAAAGPTTAGLRDRLAAWAHEGMVLTETVVDALAPVSTAVSLAELAAQRAGAVQGLTASSAAARFLDPVIGPVTAGGLRILSGLGIAVGVHDYYHGAVEGDLHRQVDGGVTAALGTAALSGNPMAVGAAGAWTLGTWGGNLINEAKEGTDFDRRFQDRMEPVFDLLGPVGMAVVPGALIVTGVESGAAAAVDAYEATRDYATDAWRSLTGADGETDGEDGGAGGR